MIHAKLEDCLGGIRVKLNNNDGDGDQGGVYVVPVAKEGDIKHKVKWSTFFANGELDTDPIQLSKHVSSFTFYLNTFYLNITTPALMHRMFMLLRLGRQDRTSSEREPGQSCTLSLETTTVQRCLLTDLNLTILRFCVAAPWFMSPLLDRGLALSAMSPSTQETWSSPHEKIRRFTPTAAPSNNSTRPRRKWFIPCKWKGTLSESVTSTSNSRCGGRAAVVLYTLQQQ